MGEPKPDREMLELIRTARTPQEKEQVRQMLGEYGDWLEAHDDQMQWRPTVQLTDEQFDELEGVLGAPDGVSLDGRLNGLG